MGGRFEYRIKYASGRVKYLGREERAARVVWEQVRAKHVTRRRGALPLVVFEAALLDRDNWQTIDDTTLDYERGKDASAT